MGPGWVLGSRELREGRHSTMQTGGDDILDRGDTDMPMTNRTVVADAPCGGVDRMGFVFPAGLVQTRPCSNTFGV